MQNRYSVYAFILVYVTEFYDRSHDASFIAPCWGFFLFLFLFFSPFKLLQVCCLMLHGAHSPYFAYIFNNELPTTSNEYSFYIWPLMNLFENFFGISAEEQNYSVIGIYWLSDVKSLSRMLASVCTIESTACWPPQAHISASDWASLAF